MCERKIRTFPMRLRTLWIKLEKEEEQFMKLTKFANALKMRNWSSKLHWKKQSLHWSKKKIRSFALNWNLAKLNKKLNEELKKRKKNWKVFERLTKEQLNQCKALWSMLMELMPKPNRLSRSTKIISRNLNLLLSKN